MFCASPLRDVASRTNSAPSIASLVPHGIEIGRYDGVPCGSFGDGVDADRPHRIECEGETLDGVDCWPNQLDVARDLFQSPLCVEFRVRREDQERTDQGEPFRSGLLVHHLSEHVAWELHIHPSEISDPFVVGAHGRLDLSDPSKHVYLLHDRLTVGSGFDQEAERKATFGTDRILWDLQHLRGELNHRPTELERSTDDQVIQQQ